MNEIKEAMEIYINLLRSIVEPHQDGTFIDVVLNLTGDFQPPPGLDMEVPDGAKMRKVEVDQNLTANAGVEAMKFLNSFARATALVSTAVFAMNEQFDGILKDKIHVRVEKKNGTLEVINTLAGMVERNLEETIKEVYDRYGLSGLLTSYREDQEFLIQILETKPEEDEQVTYLINQFRKELENKNR